MKQPWVGVACVFAMCAGCGGVRVGQVGWTAPAPAVPAPDISSYVLVASNDVVVHDTARWERRNLNDESWLMAGADRLQSNWIAYVSFDLTQVDAGDTISGAALSMFIEREPPLAGEAASATIHVHVVHGAWDETELTWASQPMVSARPVASFEVRRDDTRPADAVDVSAVVSSAVAAGASEISFALVSAEPGVDFRRRWVGRDVADVPPPSTDWTRAPQLTLSVGEPVSAPTQATLNGWLGRAVGE